MPAKSVADLLASRCRPAQPGEAIEADAIREQLEALPEWRYEDGCIVRTYRFGNYYETLAFVNAIAYIAHREDHHPDLLVGYNRCTVRFSTHSAGGITRNDFICAAKCDAVFGAGLGEAASPSASGA